MYKRKTGTIWLLLGFSFSLCLDWLCFSQARDGESSRLLCLHCPYRHPASKSFVGVPEEKGSLTPYFAFRVETTPGGRGRWRSWTGRHTGVARANPGTAAPLQPNPRPGFPMPSLNSRYDRSSVSLFHSHQKLIYLSTVNSESSRSCVVSYYQLILAWIWGIFYTTWIFTIPVLESWQSRED